MTCINTFYVYIINYKQLFLKMACKVIQATLLGYSFSLVIEHMFLFCFHSFSAGFLTSIRPMKCQFMPLVSSIRFTKWDSSDIVRAFHVQIQRFFGFFFLFFWVLVGRLCGTVPPILMLSSKTVVGPQFEPYCAVLARCKLAQRPPLLVCQPQGCCFTCHPQ